MPMVGLGRRRATSAVNPVGRVPTLVLDDGEVLIESGAMRRAPPLTTER
jgi:glutathione S-transferase